MRVSIYVYMTITWTLKVCKIMAFMATLGGLELLFYILLGFRYICMYIYVYIHWESQGRKGIWLDPRRRDLTDNVLEYTLLGLRGGAPLPFLATEGQEAICKRFQKGGAFGVSGDTQTYICLKILALMPTLHHNESYTRKMGAGRDTPNTWTPPGRS